MHFLEFLPVGQQLRWTKTTHISRKIIFKKNIVLYTTNTYEEIYKSGLLRAFGIVVRNLEERLSENILIQFAKPSRRNVY